MPGTRSKSVALLVALFLISASLNVYFATRSSGSGATGKSSSAELYVCPMHPTIVQDHFGQCPICGMNLVIRKAADRKSSGSETERKIVFYRSPMDPQQTSHEPRKDEMGMDYVPVYEDELFDSDQGMDNRTEVTIDPTRQQLIGLRTATAVYDEIRSDWRTVGRVQVDQTRVSKIHTKVSGYVVRVFADFVGKPVSRGEPLFAYYSPELLVAQQEYLLARKFKTGAENAKPSASDSLLIAAARQKLRLWDLTETQIEQLEKTGEVAEDVTVFSPVSGVITAKNIVAGSALSPGDTPYEITDLSMVWILADAYQSDLAKVSIGMEAVISVESWPDRRFSGVVSFVDRILDIQSRTAKVRINVANDHGDLRPEMFVEVMFQGAIHEALVIPADAVIPSGRESLVFVAMGDGKFEPRRIQLGEKSGDQVEVVSGLRKGERVVTRANFLIDSESSLRAALAAIGGTP